MTDFNIPKLPVVQLSLTTVPPTKVYLGAKRIGSTPLSTRIPKRETVLRFENEHLGLRVTRRLSPGGTQISTRYVFRKGVIGFRVPPGTRVHLDGRPLGVAPIKPQQVFEGQHTVVCRPPESSGKRVRQVTVAPGKTVWVNL